MPVVNWVANPPAPNYLPPPVPDPIVEPRPPGRLTRLFRRLGAAWAALFARGSDAAGVADVCVVGGLSAASAAPRAGLAVSPGVQAGAIAWGPYLFALLLVGGYALWNSGFSLATIGQDVRDHVWPSAANAAGHKLREPILRAAQAGGQAAVAQLEAGATYEQFQTTLQTVFKTQRDQAFADVCGPVFNAAYPTPEDGKPSVEPTAAQRAKLIQTTNDCFRGLTRRW